MPSFRLKVKLENAVCTKETANAMLVLIDGEEVWIPKSQVADDSEVFDAGNNSEGTLVISEWIATEKGLI